MADPEAPEAPDLNKRSTTQSHSDSEAQHGFRVEALEGHRHSGSRRADEGLFSGLKSFLAVPGAGLSWASCGPTAQLSVSVIQRP